MPMSQMYENMFGTQIKPYEQLHTCETSYNVTLVKIRKTLPICFLISKNRIMYNMSKKLIEFLNFFRDTYIIPSLPNLSKSGKMTYTLSEYYFYKNKKKDQSVR